MKSLIISILCFISLTAHGQSITYGPDILNTKDSSIVEVRNLWISYVTNCQNGFDKTSKEYWNKYELEQGYTDIAKAAIGVPSYLFGEFKVLEIKRSDNEYFRIRSRMILGDSANMFIFTVFAKKVNNVFKLFNCFYIEKQKLQHVQADNIDFYYPNSFSFNNQRAKQIADNYAKISTLYGYMDKQRVTYIIGKNLYEANNFIGFEKTMYISSQPAAAYTIKDQNIILSSREDNLHELIHSIFMPMFPEAAALFQEGIATYYGGSAGQNYYFLVDQLKNYIIKNPDINLSKFDDLNKVLDNGTNNFYTIGAIFINYAIKVGGTKKVLALFQHPNTNEFTSADAISAISKDLGIEKDQIDSFLKKYIQNYTSN
jgi:hypothetical protein